MSMYETLGIPELADKLPDKCLPMGSLVGHLTTQAATHLNLPQGLPVSQGGPDAFVGMIGLGCINPGQLCLITGSSHLHCVVTSQPTTAPGTWGAYRGAPLPGINFAEGGQSSTGSIIRWARQLFGAGDIEYSVLDKEAATIPLGCDGLVALETFQGSRTPITDPMARGALVGLTLSHTRAHIWRALLEAVCFGTRACVEGLASAGHNCDEIIIAGGATRSDLWLQMHADVTGKPIVVCENADAPLLGCAILASVGVGVHSSVEEAVKSMVRTTQRIEPSDVVRDAYTDLYENVYQRVGSSARPVVHSMAALRAKEIRSKASAVDAVKGLQGGATNHQAEEVSPREVLPTISPSILACDWSNIRGEVERCMLAGTKRLHVDIFDGVFLDSPYALTFGPQMVKAIRSCSEEAILDLHMCVDRPSRYVEPMAKAGADSFIFQWEAMKEDQDGRLNAALILAKAVVDQGMSCGVSINPATDVKDILPLLKSGLISIVDVLAVEPGFGGQKFQTIALTKIEQLRQFREATPSGENIKIMVDGGINETTAGSVGADILVAGTFLFQHPESFSKGINQLQAASIAAGKTFGIVNTPQNSPLGSQR
jgi:ribulose-phosphate 3-epimerase